MPHFRATPPRLPRPTSAWGLPRVLAAACVAMALALCVSTYRIFGHTWDEPEHLAAGVQLLDRGLYTYDIQHPPLARLAIALGPWLDGAHAYGEPGPSGEQEGRDLLYRGGHYQETLTQARLGALLFLPVLFLASWGLGVTVLGDWAAALTVMFLALTPPVLGHAAVAALDLPGTATCTLALLALLRFTANPGAGRGLALGVAAGLAIGTKLSALPFLAMSALALPLAQAMAGQGPALPVGSRARAAGAVLLAGAGSVATLVIIYGGRFEYLTDAACTPSAALDYLAAPGSRLHAVLYAIAAWVPAPVAFEKLLLGIKALQEHNRAGHLSFLLGEARTGGWWYFYPVALAVKTPLPLLGAGLAGLAGLAGRAIRRRDWRLAVAPAWFLAILGFCMAYSRINIGVRHVLVLYPLLALGAAFALGRLWATRTGGRALALALVAWQAAVLWRAYPDYLAYFNALAPRPEAVLIDSDLDWGQDMRRLEQELRRRHVPKFSFVFRGTADWIREDLPPFTFLPPGLPTTGWVAVDVLAKFLLTRGDGGYGWLDAYRPVTRVGKTIDLYYIPGEPPGPQLP